MSALSDHSVSSSVATAHTGAVCRVAVVERGPLKGRDQEWNISRKELNELVSCADFLLAGLMCGSRHSGSMHDTGHTTPADRFLIAWLHTARQRYQGVIPKVTLRDRMHPANMNWEILLYVQVGEGLLTREEAEECIGIEFNPVRAGFYGGQDVWTRDVLNLGVRPDRAIAKVKHWLFMCALFC